MAATFFWNTPSGFCRYPLSLPSQQLAFRLGNSDWFAGGEYIYSDVDTEFKTGIDIPGLDKLDFNSKNAASGVLLIYGYLSNPYTPDSGIQSEIAYQFYDEKVGGDFNSDMLLLKNQIHFKPFDRWNIGLDFAKGPEDSVVYVSFGTKF